MTLGDEIRAAMGDLAELRLEPMADGAIAVTWSEGPRKRQVAFHEAGELLIIVAAVCRERDTSPRRVLTAAAHLNGGCAALIRGTVVLRYALPRSRRDAASMREGAVALAAAARRFGKMVGRTTATEDAVFLHYDS